MDKLLDGILKNLLSGVNNEDFKQLNEASIILGEFIINNGIEGLSEVKLSTIEYVMDKLKDRKLSALESENLKGYKLINNAENTLLNIIMKVEASKIFNIKDKVLHGQFEKSEKASNFASKMIEKINYNKAEKLLNESINNKVLITTYDESTRGVGKSKALIKKANELDCTLVTHNHTSKRYLDDIAQGLNIPVDVRYYSNSNIAKGIKFRKDGFLVDEGVSKDVILQLIDNGNKLLGGFVDLHTNEVDDTYAKIESKLNKLENELWVFHKTYRDECENRDGYIDTLNKVKALKWLLDELN